MPKRRRLLTPRRHKTQATMIKAEPEYIPPEKEVTSLSPRGRLKGALMDVLDPASDESDSSFEATLVKKEIQREKEAEKRQRIKSPPRQSYVLKLFDRSVDLSQFEENSSLYPICRAWMINQPKSNYRDFGNTFDEVDVTEDSVELPGPEGPVVSRIPELLPEQKARSKDNINLNYREAPPPTREQLLRSHSERWGAVRQAWLDQATRVEARYEATQQLLNKINVNNL